MKQIEKLIKEIAPCREKLLEHQVYSSIKNIEHLRVFMKYHAFAVWDFMSLLKKLQSELTITNAPWYAKGSADTRFFINEIVLGEECDIDEHNNRISHFELYLNAMRKAEADTSEIELFYSNIALQYPVSLCLDISVTKSLAAKAFVANTFEIINSNSLASVCGAFTFGREDLIPDMFQEVIDCIALINPSKLSTFNYYLERHIQVDGEHHRYLALKMIEEVCGNDNVKWHEAKMGAIKSLEARIKLWDAVCNEINFE